MLWKKIRKENLETYFENFLWNSEKDSENPNVKTCSRKMIQEVFFICTLLFKIIFIILHKNQVQVAILSGAESSCSNGVSSGWFKTIT